MTWITRKFSRRLAVAFCLLIAGAMALTGWISARALKTDLTREITNAMLTEAGLVARFLGPGAFDRRDPHALAGFVRDVAGVCDCRVTLVGVNGALLADSDVSVEDLSLAENHRNRPEVAAALAGSRGQAVRRSRTVDVDLLYAAVPVREGERVVGVARVALPLLQVREGVAAIRRRVTAAVSGMMLLALMVAFWMARSISRPLDTLAKVAGRISAGDYNARAPELPSDEHQRLGDALNTLAHRIDKTVTDLSQEKMRVTGILNNMVEGVLAVDVSGRMIVANPALGRLFGIVPDAAVGRPFLEVLRHGEVSELVQGVLTAREERVAEIRIFDPEPRTFEAHAAPLIREGNFAGVLLVLHDVSRLRRLEQVRKEFVANVSHELRTPLSAIKGFAETLLAGAVDDPAHRKEFVGTIERHAERMSHLIDDLLDLAAIESGRRPLVLEPVSLAEMAMEVSETLAPLAAAGDVQLETEGISPALRVRADRAQLKQVLLNLCDNALKFTPPGGRVSVSARAEDGAVLIHVQDTGVGIPEADLSRIFERFYRVDKARSRERGGTGLGLSIVKHIVEAHGGAVSVESRPGEGAVFRFSLPMAEG